MQGAAVTQC